MTHLGRNSEVMYNELLCQFTGPQHYHTISRWKRMNNHTPAVRLTGIIGVVIGVGVRRDIGGPELTACCVTYGAVGETW